jgi:putative Mn2+ efflux pump MntP
MKNMNSFQVIAIVGIIFTVVAQGLLWVLDKTVEHYVYLYPTWVAIFIFGLVINPYLSKYDDDHHHH